MNFIKKKAEKVEEIPKPEPKKEEIKEKYVLGYIATKTEPVIIDQDTEEQYDLHKMLAKIGNDIEEIKNFLSQ